MDIGLVSRVGLQLLLEPQSTAFIFRGACVATGAVYPAYATYKAVVAPKRAAPGRSNAAAVSLETERWLKYWAVFGLTCLAERLVEGHLDRLFPYYPHAKFAFLLWLQLSSGHGSSLLFDGYLTPWLSRYERKLDTLLEVGAGAAEMFAATYAGPISYMRSAVTAALGHAAAFISWLATPDEEPAGAGPCTGGTQLDSSSSSSPGRRRGACQQ